MGGGEGGGSFVPSAIILGVGSVVISSFSKALLISMPFFNVTL